MARPFFQGLSGRTLLQRPSWQDPSAKAFLARPFCKGLLGKTLLQRHCWQHPFAKALLATPFHKGGHMCSHMHAPISACTASLGAILQPPNACKWHPFAKVFPLKGARSKAYPSKLWLLLCSDSPFQGLHDFVDHFKVLLASHPADLNDQPALFSSFLFSRRVSFLTSVSLGMPFP